MSKSKWLALGGLMGLTSLLFYELKIKSKGKVQTLVILSENKMLDIFNQIKQKYRDSFKKYQKIFRNGRRKHQRNSQEYGNFVYDSYANLQRVFNESVDEVLEENSISKEVYENSWKLLKNDVSIFEAAEDMKIITPSGNLRTDLTMEDVRKCLEFCRDKFDSFPGMTENLQLAVSLLEDDLKLEYGVEIEDIEKWYYAYIGEFEDCDSLFQAIRETKSVIDI